MKNINKDYLELPDGGPTERQLKLHKALAKKNSKIADIYIGAVVVLSQNNNPAKFNLCAHGMRELMKKVPRVLDLPLSPSAELRLGDFASQVKTEWMSLKNKEPWGRDLKDWSGPIDENLLSFITKVKQLMDKSILIGKSQREVAQGIVRSRNMSQNNLPDHIERIKTKEWMSLLDYFNSKGHFSEVDEDELFDKIRLVEDFIIESIEPRTFELNGKILRLINKAEADPSDISMNDVIDLIQSHAEYTFFFHNISSDIWLDKLIEAGFFSEPLEPIVSEDGVKYPFWMPSGYLARISDKQPKKIVNRVFKFKDNGNVRIYEDFIDAGIKMPAEFSKKISQRVANWLSVEDDIHFLSTKAVKLAHHLYLNSSVMESFLIISALLNSYDETDDNSNSTLYWHYSKNLEDICKFVDAKDKIIILQTLCAKLDKSLSEGSKTDELSYIWRSSIEPSNQNSSYGFHNTLINFVRDISKDILSENELLREEVFTVLNSYEHLIFKRIRIYIISEFSFEGEIEKVISWDIADINEILWHEYAVCLNKNFNCLSKNIKNLFLEKVYNLKAIENSSEYDEDINKRLKLRLYSLIKDDLEGRYKDEFVSLESKYGVINQPTFWHYSEIWSGPTSPKNEAELSELSPEQLVLFLNTWKPSKEKYFSDSINGLARSLQVCVKKGYKKYLRAIEHFKFNEKTYIDSFIDGLSEGVSEFTSHNWEQVLKYFDWVFTLVDDTVELDEEDKYNRDLSWGPTRKSILRLLKKGLKQVGNQIPFTERVRVWEMISSCFTDQDPVKEEEPKYADGKDYYGVAINSVRSIALETCVFYAYWVKDGLGIKDAELSIDKAPEFYQRLDFCLDYKEEKSLAVRAMFGMWLPRLLMLNELWIKEKIHLLFPSNESEIELWLSCWTVYLKYHNPDLKTFSYCKENYILSLDRFDFLDVKHKSQVEGLIKHTIALYLYGHLSFEDEFLQNFLNKLSPISKKNIIKLIGRTFSNRKNDSEQLERGIKIWEHFLNEAESEFIELTVFGGWFCINDISDEWLVQNLSILANKSVPVKDIDTIFERLIVFSDSKPELTVNAIECLIKLHDINGGYYLQRSKLKHLFTLILKSEFKSDAEKFINILGRKGYVDLGLLLKK